MERPSRFESTRRQLRLARYVVVAGATAAFGAFVLVARAGHAGKSTSSVPTASAVSQSSSGDGSSVDSQSQPFGYGSSSISPSFGGAPLAQSSGS